MPSTDRVEPFGSRPAKLFALLVLLVFLAVNFAGLGWYPMPHCDEVYHIATSHAFFDQGRYAHNLLGNLQGYDTNVAAQGRLFLTLMGAQLELLGYRLAAARLFSALGLLLGALFTFLLGRRLFGTSAGLAATLILVASNNAFYASHIARTEIWVAAAGAGLLAYYLVVRAAPARLRHVSLGLLMALALSIHPNTFWYSLPIGLLVLYDNYRTAEGRARVLLVVMGGLLGVVLVAAMQLLPDPPAAIRNIQNEAAVNNLVGFRVLDHLLGQLNMMWSYYFLNLNSSVVVATAYFLFGIGYAIVRRTSGDRLLLATLGISIAGFALVMPHKNPFYGVLWEPLLALLAGAGVVRLAASLSERRPSIGASRPAVLLLAPLLVASLASQVWLTVKFSPRNLDRYLSEVREHVQPGSRVMGDPALWFAFREGYTLIADSYFDYCRGTQTCSEIDRQEAARILDALAVEVVVEDGALGCSTTPTPASQVWADHLAETCVRVGVVENRWFGAYGQEGRGRETRIYDCTGR